jgi:hypothetical protein
MKHLHIHKPWCLALDVIIVLVFLFLGIVSIHWGLTVKDTASGMAVLSGGFLVFYAIKMAIRFYKFHIIFGEVEP